MLERPESPPPPPIRSGSRRSARLPSAPTMREVWWTTEMALGKRSYKHIKILPASDAALGWINAQLQKDGYGIVP